VSGPSDLAIAVFLDAPTSPGNPHGTPGRQSFPAIAIYKSLRLLHRERLSTSENELGQSGFFTNTKCRRRP